MKHELKLILLLAFPIIGNGFIETMIGFITTILVAHLGESYLAVNALVSLLFITINVIFWGILSGISILVANYHGANKKDDIPAIIRDGLILSVILSIPIALFLWFAPNFFAWAGQSTYVVNQSRAYLHALIWAVPFDLPGVVFMQLYQGIAKPRINLILTLLYFPILIVASYCLMFGKFGLPAVGLAGIGWGTALAYAVFLVCIWFYTLWNSDYRRYVKIRKSSSSGHLKEIMQLGWPLGSSYILELSYFFVFALLIGKLSFIYLAAHQIVIQYFWVIMNVVFCIGQALTIRVSWSLGKNEPARISSITQIGVVICMVFIILASLLYCLSPEKLIALDFWKGAPPERSLISAAILFFMYAAAFQIVDTLRSVYASILRGMQDTQFVFWTTLIMFWVIGLPCGYYFAFILHQGPIGLWGAAIIGSLVATALSVLRIHYKKFAYEKPL